MAAFVPQVSNIGHIFCHFEDEPIDEVCPNEIEQDGFLPQSGLGFSEEHRIKSSKIKTLQHVIQQTTTFRLWLRTLLRMTGAPTLCFHFLFQVYLIGDKVIIIL